MHIVGWPSAPQQRLRCFGTIGDNSLSFPTAGGRICSVFRWMHALLSALRFPDRRPIRLGFPHSLTTKMKAKVVTVPTIKLPIQKSPGFAKKKLSDNKLDLLALCGFGCRYCSSNPGYYLRINRKKFAKLAKQQLGTALTPADDPALTYEFDDILGALRTQVSNRRAPMGSGKTLMFSMLTDPFSPRLAKGGVTLEALKILLEGTDYRIRVLTKNAVVGKEEWVRFFDDHPGRFIVGLSIGTTDDAWSKRVEEFTSPPTSRLRALRMLQDAGVPTYGMLCPIFPDVLAAGTLESLIDEIRPAHCEHVWAEPFNDRQNWEAVREGYSKDSEGHRWLSQVFGERRRDLWSDYATEL
jgi:DNA repair photolyase